MSLCVDDPATGCKASTSTAVTVLRCVELIVQLVTIASSALVGSTLSAPAGVPCVFEGHLKTDKNWYGYLANISVVTTARMTFEFTYAADRCCQNVLFYTEDQTSIISARMNCWQKEYLLRPEDDQILRLTPRFSWSGCHMTHPGGLSTYHCEGGRSFTVDTMSLPGVGQSAGGPPITRPSAWYIAASNCAALHGLDLRYRLVVYGHVGDCPPSPDETVSGRGQSVRSSLLVQHDGVGDGSADGDGAAVSDGETASCRLEGSINSTSPWFGFLGNMSLARGGGFRFQFRFQMSPSTTSSMSALRVLLYRPEDVTKLSAEQACWRKNGVIRPQHEEEQVILLSAGMSRNGCVSDADGLVSCQGERRYDDPQRWHAAASDCHSVHGLQLDYELDVHGVTNPDELCSGTPRLDTTSIRVRTYSLAFVIAGLIRTSSNSVSSSCC